MLNRRPELPVYHVQPLTVVKGRGVTVYDEAGVEYLDLYGGHAVAASGHCHPRVVRAIAAQAEQLLFYSNAVEMPVRRELCGKLLDLAGGRFAAVFLTNSGAEANEAALTIARLATGRRKIASVTGGFHGRSLLTLSLSGLERYRALTSVAGEPLFAHGVVLPFGDVRAARETIDDSFAAIIVEPVQGLAGCLPLPADYLAALREIADRTGARLIFDEVQCGVGRTGAFFAAEHTGVWPDLISLAKGLAAGFPIGATLVAEHLLPALNAGDLGTTFGGGPLACAAALANLAAIEEEQMIANAREVGAYLITRLTEIHGVTRVQGRGLMIGAVLDRPASAVASRLLQEHHILAGTSAIPEVLRLLPPLNLRREHADRFCAALSAVLEKP